MSAPTKKSQDPFDYDSKPFKSYARARGYDKTFDLVKKMADTTDEETEYLMHGLSIGNVAESEDKQFTTSELKNIKKAVKVNQHTEDIANDPFVQKAVAKYGKDVVNAQIHAARRDAYKYRNRQYEAALRDPANRLNNKDISPEKSQRHKHNVYEKAGQAVGASATDMHKTAEMMNVARYENASINANKINIPKKFIDPIVHFTGVVDAGLKYVNTVGAVVSDRAKSPTVIAHSHSASTDRIHANRPRDSANRAKNVVDEVATIKLLETEALFNEIRKVRRSDRVTPGLGGFENLNGAALAAVIPGLRPSKPYTKKVLKKPVKRTIQKITPKVDPFAKATEAGRELQRVQRVRKALVKASEAGRALSGPSYLDAIKSDIKAREASIRHVKPQPKQSVKVSQPTRKPSLLSRVKSFAKRNAVDIASLGLGSLGLAAVGSLIGSVPMFAMGTPRELLNKKLKYVHVPYGKHTQDQEDQIAAIRKKLPRSKQHDDASELMDMGLAGYINPKSGRMIYHSKAGVPKAVLEYTKQGNNAFYIDHLGSSVKGAGYSLFQNLVDEARLQNKKKIILDSVETPATVKSYKRWGFHANSAGKNLNMSYDVPEEGYARGGVPGMQAQMRTFFNRDVRHLAREQMQRMMLGENDPYQISGYGDAAQQFQGDPRGLNLSGLGGWFAQRNYDLASNYGHNFASGTKHELTAAALSQKYAPDQFKHAVDVHNVAGLISNELKFKKDTTPLKVAAYMHDAMKTETTAPIHNDLAKTLIKSSKDLPKSIRKNAAIIAGHHKGKISNKKLKKMGSTVAAQVAIIRAADAASRRKNLEKSPLKTNKKGKVVLGDVSGLPKSRIKKISESAKILNKVKGYKLGTPQGDLPYYSFPDFVKKNFGHETDMEKINPFKSDLQYFLESTMEETVNKFGLPEALDKPVINKVGSSPMLTALGKANTLLNPNFKAILASRPPDVRISNKSSGITMGEYDGIEHAIKLYGQQFDNSNDIKHAQLLKEIDPLHHWKDVIPDRTFNFDKVVSTGVHEEAHAAAKIMQKLYGLDDHYGKIYDKIGLTKYLKEESPYLISYPVSNASENFVHDLHTNYMTQILGNNKSYHSDVFDMEDYSKIMAHTDNALWRAFGTETFSSGLEDSLQGKSIGKYSKSLQPYVIPGNRDFLRTEDVLAATDDLDMYLKNKSQYAISPYMLTAQRDFRNQFMHLPGMTELPRINPRKDALSTYKQGELEYPYQQKERDAALNFAWPAWKFNPRPDDSKQNADIDKLFGRIQRKKGITVTPRSDTDAFFAKGGDPTERPGNTSIPQVSKGLKFIGVNFPVGSKVLDYGGGKFDLGMKYLMGKGMTPHVYDPDDNRPQWYKDWALSQKYDVVGLNNVLNVINDEDIRRTVIQSAFDRVKKGGNLVATMYEGPKGDGIARKVDRGNGEFNWQLNRKTASYKPEIEDALKFEVPKPKGGIFNIPKYAFGTDSFITPKAHSPELSQIREDAAKRLQLKRNQVQAAQRLADLRQKTQIDKVQLKNIGLMRHPNTAAGVINSNVVRNLTARFDPKGTAIEKARAQLKRNQTISAKKIQGMMNQTRVWNDISGLASPDYYRRIHEGYDSPSNISPKMMEEILQSYTEVGDIDEMAMERVWDAVEKKKLNKMATMYYDAVPYDYTMSYLNDVPWDREFALGTPKAFESLPTFNYNDPSVNRLGVFGQKSYWGSFEDRKVRDAAFQMKNLDLMSYPSYTNDRDLRTISKYDSVNDEWADIIRESQYRSSDKSYRKYIMKSVLGRTDEMELDTMYRVFGPNTEYAMNPEEFMLHELDNYRFHINKNYDTYGDLPMELPPLADKYFYGQVLQGQNWDKIVIRDALGPDSTGFDRATNDRRDVIKQRAFDSIVTGNKTFQYNRNKFTDAQKMALDAYFGNTRYRAVRAFNEGDTSLLGGLDITNAELRQTPRIIRILNGLMDTSVIKRSAGIPVYRGVSPGIGMYKQIQNGQDEISDLSPMSFSYRFATASAFSRLGKHDPVILRYVMGENEPGLLRGDREHEALLKPGKFEILDKSIYNPNKTPEGKSKISTIYDIRRLARGGIPGFADGKYVTPDSLYLPGTEIDYTNNWERLQTRHYNKMMKAGLPYSDPSLVGWYTRMPSTFRNLYEMSGGTGDVTKDLIQKYNKKYKTDLVKSFYPIGDMQDHFSNVLVDQFAELKTHMNQNVLPFTKPTTLFRGIDVDKKFGKSILDQITDPDLQGINLESLKDNALHNFTLKPNLAADYAVGDRKYKGYSGVMLRMLQQGDMKGATTGNPDLFAILSNPSEYSLSAPTEDVHLKNNRGDKLGKVAVATVSRQLMKKARGGSPGNLIRVSDEELGLTKSQFKALGGISVLEPIRQAANAGKSILPFLRGAGRSSGLEFEGKGTPTSDDMLFDTSRGDSNPSNDIVYIVSHKMRKAMESVGKLSPRGTLGALPGFAQGGFPGFATGTPDEIDEAVDRFAGTRRTGSGRRHRQTGANRLDYRYRVRPDQIDSVTPAQRRRSFAKPLPASAMVDEKAPLPFYGPTRYMRDVMGMETRDAYNMERAMSRGRRMKKISISDIKSFDPYKNDMAANFLRKDLEPGQLQNPHGLLRKFQAAQANVNFKESGLGRYNQGGEPTVDQTNPADIITRSMQNMNTAITKVTAGFTKMDKEAAKIVRKSQQKGQGGLMDISAWMPPNRQSIPNFVPGLDPNGGNGITMPQKQNLGQFIPPTQIPQSISAFQKASIQQQRALAKQIAATTKVQNLGGWMENNMGPDSRQIAPPPSQSVPPNPNYVPPTPPPTGPGGTTIPPNTQHNSRAQPTPPNTPPPQLPPAPTGFQKLGWQDYITNLQKNHPAFKTTANVYKGIAGETDVTNFLQKQPVIAALGQHQELRQSFADPKQFIGEDLYRFNQNKGTNISQGVLDMFQTLQDQLRGGIDDAKGTKAIHNPRRSLDTEQGISRTNITDRYDEDARADADRTEQEVRTARARRARLDEKQRNQERDIAYKTGMQATYGDDGRFEIDRSGTHAKTHYRFENVPELTNKMEEIRAGYRGQGAIANLKNNIPGIRRFRQWNAGSFGAGYDRFKEAFLNEGQKEVVSTTGQTTMKTSFLGLHPQVAEDQLRNFDTQKQIEQVRANLNLKHGELRGQMEDYLQQEFGDVKARGFLKLDFTDDIKHETESGFVEAETQVTVGFEALREKLQQEYRMTESEIDSFLVEFQKKFNEIVTTPDPNVADPDRREKLRTKKADFVNETKYEKGEGFWGKPAMKVNKLAKDMSWKAASISMSSMGVYFSLMGVFMQLQGVLSGLLGSLSDLSGAFKNMAYVQAFGGGMQRVNEIMGAAGVTQNDLVEGWKGAQAVQSAFALSMSSVAAALFKDKKFVDELIDGIQGLFKELLKGDSIDTFKKLLTAVADALPAVVIGLEAFVWTIQELNKAGLLKPLISMAAYLMTLTMLIQPLTSGISLFLAVIATGAELTAVFGGISAGILAVGSAFLTASVYAIAFLAVIEGIERIYELFTGDKLLKPSDLIGGAIGLSANVIGVGRESEEGYAPGSLDGNRVKGPGDDKSLFWLGQSKKQFWALTGNETVTSVGDSKGNEATLTAIDNGVKLDKLIKVSPSVIGRSSEDGYMATNVRLLPSNASESAEENYINYKTVNLLDTSSISNKKVAKVLTNADEGDGLGVYVKNFPDTWGNASGNGEGQGWGGLPFDLGLPNPWTLITSRTPLGKPEIKPEVKAETKPEAKPEVKVEVKAEIKVEIKPEVKAETKAEVKSETKPEIKTETKTEAKSIIGKLVELKDRLFGKEEFKSTEDLKNMNARELRKYGFERSTEGDYYRNIYNDRGRIITKESMSEGEVFEKIKSIKESKSGSGLGRRFSGFNRENLGRAWRGELPGSNGWGVRDMAMWDPLDILGFSADVARYGPEYAPYAAANEIGGNVITVGAMMGTGVTGEKLMKSSGKQVVDKSKLYKTITTRTKAQQFIYEPSRKDTAFLDALDDPIARQAYIDAGGNVPMKYVSKGGIRNAAKFTAGRALSTTSKVASKGSSILALASVPLIDLQGMIYNYKFRQAQNNGTATLDYFDKVSDQMSLPESFLTQGGLGSSGQGAYIRDKMDRSIQYFYQHPELIDIKNGYTPDKAAQDAVWGALKDENAAYDSAAEKFDNKIVRGYTAGLPGGAFINLLNKDQKSAAMQGLVQTVHGTGIALQDVFDYYTGINTSGKGLGNYNWKYANQDLSGEMVNIASVIADLAGYKDVGTSLRDANTVVNDQLNMSNFGDLTNIFDVSVLRKMEESSLLTSDALKKVADDSSSLGVLYNATTGSIIGQNEAMLMSTKEFQALTPAVLNVNTGMLTFNDGIQENVSKFSNISSSISTLLADVEEMQATSAAYVENYNKMGESLNKGIEMVQTPEGMTQTGEVGWVGISNSNEPLVGAVGVPQSVMDMQKQIDDIKATQISNQIPQSQPQQMEITIFVSGSDKNEIANQVLAQIEAKLPSILSNYRNSLNKL